MYQSKVDAYYQFNKQNWIVSLVNSGTGMQGVIGGHSVIVVEGLNEDGTIFQGEYDINAVPYEDEQKNANSTLSNTQGVISKIRCNPTAIARQQNHPETAVFHREYSNLSSKSWEVSPAKALEMIKSIENDAHILEEELNKAIAEERNVNWPFKYQKAGSARWTIFGGNGGDNCTTWAENKLAIAGAGNGQLPLDAVKALPAKHVCVML